MLIIITRCVHIGACLILLSLFAFEMLIATPALRQADRSVVEHVEALRGQFRWLVVWSGLCLCKIFACLKDYLRLGRPVFLAQARHVKAAIG